MRLVNEAAQTNTAGLVKRFVKGTPAGDPAGAGIAELIGLGRAAGGRLSEGPPGPRFYRLTNGRDPWHVSPP